MTALNGPCLVVDPEHFGPEFPCQLLAGHDGKHHNEDEGTAVEWLMPIYGPQKPSGVIVPPTAADIARHYGVGLVGGM